MNGIARVVAVLAIIVAIVWVAGQPAQAGDTVHGWIGAIITFVRHAI